MLYLTNKSNHSRTYNSEFYRFYEIKRRVRLVHLLNRLKGGSQDISTLLTTNDYLHAKLDKEKYTLLYFFIKKFNNFVSKQ